MGTHGTGMFAIAVVAAVACGTPAGGDSSPDGGVPGASSDGGVSTDGAVPSAPLDGSNGEGGPAVLEPPLVPLTFAPTDADFLNPERGFHTTAETTPDALCAYGGPDPSQLRAQGYALLRAYVHLDAFRAAPIGATCLGALQTMFDRVRAGGIKLVLRFAYNAAAGVPDAPKAIMLGHIAQLAPLFATNADVIAVLQAGFIGAWGEWHDSTNGLDNDADHKAILTALLAALPASRMVQIRTPAQKQAIYGGPLADAAAFSGSDAARIGHHNDCYLASDTDQGTYDPPPIAPWKTFLAQEARFTPFGVETCAVNAPRSSCPAALAESAMLHLSYANADYEPNVLTGWTSQGCMAAMRRQQGYRFVLRAGQISARVKPGGVLRLHIEIHNDGWASPWNARPVYVVLDDGTGRREAILSRSDPRRWESAGDVAFDARLRIPALAHAGNARVTLWLPDAADTLRSRPEYAIRFANQGTWSDVAGDNRIAEALVVDPQAPGEVDPAAGTFAELP